MKKKLIPVLPAVGMRTDYSVATPTKNTLTNAQNIRINTATDSNAVYSISNEKGVAKYPIEKLVNLTSEEIKIGKIIGHVDSLYYSVVFSILNGLNYITLLKYNGSKVIATVLYSGKLNFDERYPIEGVFIEETKSLHKVYWVDGFNQARLLKLFVDDNHNPLRDDNDNIQGILSNNDSQFDFKGTLTTENISKLKINVTPSFSGTGLFNPGVLQWGISFYNKYGQQTGIITLSSLYYITDNGRGLNPDGTQKSSISFTITVDGLSNVPYDHYKVYRIFRSTLDGDAVCTEIADGKVDDLKVPTQAIKKETTYNETTTLSKGITFIPGYDNVTNLLFDRNGDIENINWDNWPDSKVGSSNFNFFNTITSNPDIPVNDSNKYKTVYTAFAMLSDSGKAFGGKYTLSDSDAGQLAKEYIKYNAFREWIEYKPSVKGYFDESNTAQKLKARKFLGYKEDDSIYLPSQFDREHNGTGSAINKENLNKVDWRLYSFTNTVSKENINTMRTSDVWDNDFRCNNKQTNWAILFEALQLTTGESILTPFNDAFLRNVWYVNGTFLTDKREPTQFVGAPLLGSSAKKPTTFATNNLGGTESEYNSLKRNIKSNGFTLVDLWNSYKHITDFKTIAGTRKYTIVCPLYYGKIWFKKEDTTYKVESPNGAYALITLDLIWNTTGSKYKPSAQPIKWEDPNSGLYVPIPRAGKTTSYLGYNIPTDKIWNKWALTESMNIDDADKYIFDVDVDGYDAPVTFYKLQNSIPVKLVDEILKKADDPLNDINILYTPKNGVTYKDTGIYQYNGSDSAYIKEKAQRAILLNSSDIWGNTYSNENMNSGIDTSFNSLYLKDYDGELLTSIQRVNSITISIVSEEDASLILDAPTDTIFKGKSGDGSEGSLNEQYFFYEYDVDNDSYKERNSELSQLLLGTKPVAALSTKKRTEITTVLGGHVYDNGQAGTSIDSQSLFYLGGDTIIPYTLSIKDSRIFFGNNKYPENEAIAEVKKYFTENTPYTVSYIDKEVDKNNDDNRTIKYFYQSNLLKSNSEFTFYQFGETYRVGIQLLSKSGKWSDVVYLGDYKNTTNRAVVYNKSEYTYTRPLLQVQLNNDAVTTIKSLGYIASRIVVVYPDFKDRHVLCQGILCPTLFNLKDRHQVSAPYVYSSWFARPQSQFSPVQKVGTFKDGSSTFHGLFPSALEPFNGSVLENRMSEKTSAAASTKTVTVAVPLTPAGISNSGNVNLTPNIYKDIKAPEGYPNIIYVKDCYYTYNNAVYCLLIKVSTQTLITAVSFELIKVGGSSISWGNYTGTLSPSSGNRLDGQGWKKYGLTYIDRGGYASLNLSTSDSVEDEAQGINLNTIGDSVKHGGLNIADNISVPVFTISGYYEYMYLSLEIVLGDGAQFTNSKSQIFLPQCSLPNGEIYAQPAIPEYPFVDTKTIAARGDYAWGIDKRICDFLSPELDYSYDSSLTSESFKNVKFRVVGYAPMKTTLSDINMSVTSPFRSFATFYNPGVQPPGYDYNDYGAGQARSLINYPFWLDGMETTKDGKDDGKNTRITGWCVYPWQRVGSLTNQATSSELTKSQLETKNISNLRVCSPPCWVDTTNNHFTTDNRFKDNNPFDVPVEDFIIYNNIDEQIQKLNVWGMSVVYSGTCNKSVIVDGQIMHARILDSKQNNTTFTNINELAQIPKSVRLIREGKRADREVTTYSNTLFNNAEYDMSSIMNNKLVPIQYRTSTHGVIAFGKSKRTDGATTFNYYNLLPDIQIQEKPGADLVTEGQEPLYQVEEISGWGTYWGRGNESFPKDDTGNRVISNSTIPSVYDSGLYQKSIVADRNYGLPNLTQAYGYNTGAGNYYIIGELYRDIENQFGGTSETALLNNKWTICSDMYPLTNASITMTATQGDTAIMRYDHLKSYPYTDKDKNQNVDIVSFMCETRIMADGRYDRNRGNDSNIAINKTNFNLFNSIYNQRNNFFAPVYISNDDITSASFPSQVAFSLPKNYGADIDLWTSINSINSIYLNSNYGQVTSLQLINNILVAFQDTAISQIQYNDRVALASEQGVPVELGNSNAVTGYNILTNNYGAANKWAIVQTPRGIYFIDTKNKAFILYNENGFQDLGRLKGFSSSISSFIIDKVLDLSEYKSNVLFYDKEYKDIHIGRYGDTVAYNEDLGEFTSYYSYVNCPILIYLDNAPFIKTNIDGPLFKLHSVAKNQIITTQQYNIFPSGSDTESYSSTLSLLINSDFSLDKIFDTLEFRTDDAEEIKGLRDYTSYGDKNNAFMFNSLKLTNEYQESTSGANYQTLRKKFRTWRWEFGRWKRQRIRNPWAEMTLETNKDYTGLIRIYDANVVCYSDQY